MSDKGFIYKNLQLSKQSNFLIGKTCEMTLQQRYMNDKHVKTYSTSLVIREMLIKISMKYHYTPTKIIKVKD